MTTDLVTATAITTTTDAVLEYEGQRVVTTKQLAEFYECNESALKQNFLNNKDKHIEGITYYVFEGEELKSAQKIFAEFIPKGAKKFYLWTEEGALLHCKSINTDQAWEVFLMLVKTYFSGKKKEPESPLMDFEAAKRVATAIENHKVALETFIRDGQKHLKELAAIQGKDTLRRIQTRRNTGVTAEDLRLRLLELGVVINVSKLVDIGRKLGYHFLNGVDSGRKGLVLQDSDKNLEQFLEDLQNYQVD